MPRKKNSRVGRGDIGTMGHLNSQAVPQYYGNMGPSHSMMGPQGMVIPPPGMMGPGPLGLMGPGPPNMMGPGPPDLMGPFHNGIMGHNGQMGSPHGMMGPPHGMTGPPHGMMGALHGTMVPGPKVMTGPGLHGNHIGGPLHTNPVSRNQMAGPHHAAPSPQDQMDPFSFPPGMIGPPPHPATMSPPLPTMAQMVHSHITTSRPINAHGELIHVSGIPDAQPAEDAVLWISAGRYIYDSRGNPIVPALYDPQTKRRQHDARGRILIPSNNENDHALHFVKTFSPLDPALGCDPYRTADACAFAAQFAQIERVEKGVGQPEGHHVMWMDGAGRIQAMDEGESLPLSSQVAGVGGVAAVPGVMAGGRVVPDWAALLREQAPPSLFSVPRTYQPAPAGEGEGDGENENDEEGDEATPRPLPALPVCRPRSGSWPLSGSEE